ncbi:hypothetical protein BGZ50_009236, partial [Haplosporangium sp. Z 11]
TEAYASPNFKRRRYNAEADIEEQGDSSMIKSTFPQKLERIYKAIKKEGFSLPKFLYKLFASQERPAVHLASQFYESHAPRTLIKMWNEKLRRRSKWDASFVESSVDVVVDRTRRDLRRSSKGVIGQVDPPLERPAYQFPYNTVTQANIEHLINRGFLDSYIEHATCLRRFLERVLSKDKRKIKGKERRMNEEEVRSEKMDDSEDKPKDNSKDLTDNKKSEVVDTTEKKVEEKDAKEKYDVEMMDFADVIESQKVVRLAQTIEADGHTEREDAVKVEEKVKNSVPTRRRPHRNPVSVRGCIAAMLLFMTSQKFSDDQVRKALVNMTKDAQAQVKKAVLNSDWFVVYDNINIAIKHQHQRINNLDTFDNGTSATVILIPTKENCEKAECNKNAVYDETNEQNDRGLDDEISSGEEDEISSGDDGEYESDKDDKNYSDGESDTDDESDIDDECSENEEGRDIEHEEVGEKDRINGNYPSRPPITVFQPDKLAFPGVSIFFPNAADRTLFRTVCRHHFSSAVAQSPAHIVPIVEVDLLPTRKTIAFPLQTMKIDESTIAGNLSVLETITDVGLGLARNWFATLPNIIVAGDQMTVARLLSLQIHRAIDPDPFGSLSWVHPVPQLFHMRMTLCGTIFRTHYGDSNRRGTLASFITLLRRKNLTKESLNFKAADELLKIVFEALLLLLKEFLIPIIGVSDEFDILQVADSIFDTLINLDPLTTSQSPKIFDRPCTTADINALLLLRDVAVYIELGSAIKAGDIGRIRSILPTITMMMHGGGNTNYARELLRLLHGMRHTWTVEWKRRVLSSMLVNPKGVVGEWMATDMYQETNNYLLKAVFAAKGPNMSWEYLRDYVSTNIRAFQEIARMFEQAVGAKFHNPAHVRSSFETEVHKVKMAFKDSGILTWELSEDKRAFPDPVVDLQREDGAKMMGGALDKFMASKIDHQGAEGLEETETAALSEHVD